MSLARAEAGILSSPELPVNSSPPFAV